MEWLSDIPDALEVILGIFALLTAVAGIVVIIFKTVKWLQKPAETTREELQKQEKFTEEERSKIRLAVETNQKAIEKAFLLLDKDNKKISEFEISCKLIYKALWVLLDSTVTEESPAPMRDVRDELRDHIMYK